jgi:hypothetical protein
MTSRLARILVLPVLIAAGAAAAQQASPPPGVAHVRKLCMADIQRLCPDVQPGHGAIAMCLRDHQNDVSADCRSALQAARERARERHAADAPPAETNSPPRR